MKEFELYNIGNGNLQNFRPGITLIFPEDLLCIRYCNDPTCTLGRTLMTKWRGSRPEEGRVEVKLSGGYYSMSLGKRYRPELCGSRGNTNIGMYLEL